MLIIKTTARSAHRLQYDFGILIKKNFPLLASRALHLHAGVLVR